MVTMNQLQMTLGGKYLGQLRESNDILDSVGTLRQRFEEGGY